MTAKFKFYEVVRVSDNSRKKRVRGFDGAIMGMAVSELGEWFYSVHLYSLGESWYLSEKDIESTGRMDSRESFYSEDHKIRVRVNPDTLEGEIVTENEDGKGR